MPGKNAVLYYLNRAIFNSICTDLLRIKDSRNPSTYPWVCLRFSQTLLHQDLGTSLPQKSLNLGNKIAWSLLLNKKIRAKIVPGNDFSDK